MLKMARQLLGIIEIKQIKTGRTHRRSKSYYEYNSSQDVLTNLSDELDSHLQVSYNSKVEKKCRLANRKI